MSDSTIEKSPLLRNEAAFDAEAQIRGTNALTLTENREDGNVVFNPIDIFRAMEGQHCAGITGEFCIIVGQKGWVLLVEDGKVTCNETVAEKMDATAEFTGTIKYESERSWIRSIDGTVPDVKLQVLGKMHVLGDTYLVQKLRQSIIGINNDLAATASPEVLEKQRKYPYPQNSIDGLEFEMDPMLIESLHQARWACCIYYFVIEVSWGVFAAIYTYYIQQNITRSRNDAIEISSMMFVIYGIVHFLTASTLGRLSDKVGRRPIIIVGCGLHIVGFALWSLVRDSFWWSFIGVIFLADGSTAALYTVIVDCAVLIPVDQIGTKDDFCIARWVYFLMRPANYNLRKPDIGIELRAAFLVLWLLLFTGLFIGDVLGSFIYNHFGATLGMLFSSLILGPMFAYLYFYLPESLQEYQKKDQVPFSTTGKSFVVDQTMNIGLMCSSNLVFALAFLYSCAVTVHAVELAVYLYYLEEKYDWDESNIENMEISIYLFVPLSAYLVNSHLIPACGFEISFAICYFVAGSCLVIQNFQFADSDWTIYMVGIFQCFSVSCTILVFGIITPLVDHANAGRLQGGLYALTSIGTVIGTYGGYRLYNKTYLIDFGAPLWTVCAVVNMICVATCLAMIRMKKTNILVSAT